MSQNPVLACHRNEVRCDADNEKIKKRDKRLKRNVISLGIGLNELETDSATGKIIERIMAVLSFRIEYRYRLRKLIFRKMMIADDHIYAFTAGILHLFVGLDSTV